MTRLSSNTWYGIFSFPEKFIFNPYLFFIWKWNILAFMETFLDDILSLFFFLIVRWYPQWNCLGFWGIKPYLAENSLCMETFLVLDNVRLIHNWRREEYVSYLIWGNLPNRNPLNYKKHFFVHRLSRMNLATFIFLLHILFMFWRIIWIEVVCVDLASVSWQLFSLIENPTCLLTW
jgi:hypothetical protein